VFSLRYELILKYYLLDELRLQRVKNVSGNMCRLHLAALMEHSCSYFVKRSSTLFGCMTVGERGQGNWNKREITRVNLCFRNQGVSWLTAWPLAWYQTYINRSHVFLQMFTESSSLHDRLFNHAFRLLWSKRWPVRLTLGQSCSGIVRF
jgi:hypothetical protein